MKLSRAALVSLCLTALFVACFGGYLVGRNTRPEPYLLTAERSVHAQPAGGGANVPAGKININTAGAGELELLPGIGPARAEAIVAAREEDGPFAAPEDLLRISGIGEATLRGLYDYVTVTEEDGA